jgi:hypothetical protein
VFGGAHYPIFWIDMAKDGELASLEDKLLAPRQNKNEDIHKFCSQFFSVTSQYTFPPFISSDTESDISRQPEDYEEKVAALVRNYAFEMISDAASEAAAEAENPPADSEQIVEHPHARPAADNVVEVDIKLLFEKLREGQASRLPTIPRQTDSDED